MACVNVTVVVTGICKIVAPPPIVVSNVEQVGTGKRPNVVVPHEVTVDFVPASELTLALYDVETLSELRVVSDVPVTVE